MPGAVIQIALGDVRGGDALIARLVLGLARQQLQLVADHIARRQPQGQAGADLVGDGEQAQLLADLAVIALGLLLQAQNLRVQLFLGQEGQGVDALELGVVLVAAPIGAGDGAQLEMAHLAGVIHVRTAAQIDEIAGAEEGHGLCALAHNGLVAGLFRDGRRALVAQELQELHFQRLVLALHIGDGVGDRQLFTDEAMLVRPHFLHALFNLRQIVQRQRLRQGDVIEEPGRCRRPHAKLRVRIQILDRGGHQVRGRMAARLDGEGVLRHGSGLSDQVRTKTAMSPSRRTREAES